MAKYDPLRAVLAEREDRVELSFEEIDRLVGGLPTSARNHREWWANTHATPQARAWLTCGRRVEMVSFARERVRFAPPASDGVTARARDHVGVPVPQLTGGELDVRVLARWEVVGAVTVDGKGRPLFPTMPAEPGVYRVVLVAAGEVSSVYVGETDNLRRRAKRYRDPGTDRTEDLRASARLRDHLRAGGEVSVEVATEVRLYVAGQRSAVDLSSRSARVLVEQAAVVELVRSQVELAGR